MYDVISDLTIPNRHKKFIRDFLEKVQGDERIARVILFGSCAKGTARANSDIDLLITTREEVGEEAELAFYNYLPPYSEDYVPCDLLVMPEQRYVAHRNTPFYVQKYVNAHGVELYGQL